jgi:hypothetical protein
LFASRIADAVMEGQQMLTEGGASAEPVPEDKSSVEAPAATGELAGEIAETQIVAADGGEPQAATEPTVSEVAAAEPVETVLPAEPETESAEVVAAN